MVWKKKDKLNCWTGGKKEEFAKELRISFRGTYPVHIHLYNIYIYIYIYITYTKTDRQIDQ